jgi:hypothetical protein
LLLAHLDFCLLSSHLCIPLHLLHLRLRDGGIITMDVNP